MALTAVRLSHPGRGGHPRDVQVRAVGLCLFGLSAAQAASLCGVSQPSVSAWCRDPVLRMEAAIAAAKAA